MDREFRRKIEKKIVDYFERPDDPILLIDGARQIGKSHVIRRLGKAHFEHFLEINLVEDKYRNRYFEKVRNTKEFYFAVQSIAESKFGNKDDTLIFIDEIQEYPELITLLKFLREDGKYRFIASGSLLGVTLKKTLSIPIGSISIERMYPMDFEEFLWAEGRNEEFIENVKKALFVDKNVPEGVHKRMLSLFKEYLICGGLPFCVNLMLSENDIIRLRDAQKEIHSMYIDDSTKYDKENKLHTKDIFELIPSNMENKKRRIFIKDIENKEDARFESYKEDFDDLISSGVVLKSNCCNNPTFRLIEAAKRNLLKLFYGDVGLLTMVLYKNNVMPLLSDEPYANLGNVYETAVAMQLAAKGRELYYYDKKKLGEVDFLIDDYDTMSIIPIEVKSGKDYNEHNAIDKLVKSNKHTQRGYVLSNFNDTHNDGKLSYLPIYAVMFI